MSFFDSDLGRAGVGFATGGLSEVARALRPGGGGGGFAPIPYDRGAGNSVDIPRLSAAFKQATGRDATKDELDHFSTYIKNGDLDYNEIGQIAQGLPEAQQARLGQYGDQYASQLGKYDDQILGKAANVAQGQFAGLGRPDSSGLNSAFAGAAQNLAQQRQGQLASFYGNGYNNLLNQYQSLGQGAQNRGYALNDSRTEYNRGLNGYQTQRNDYMSLLEQQNQMNRRNALAKGIGSLAGAGIGALAGGPAGAQAGAGVGGNLGGLFGS